MSVKKKLDAATKAALAAGQGWEVFHEAQRQLKVQNDEAAAKQAAAGKAIFDLGVEIGLFHPADEMRISGETKFNLLRLLESGRLVFNSEVA